MTAEHTLAAARSGCRRAATTISPSATAPLAKETRATVADPARSRCNGGRCARPPRGRAPARHLDEVGAMHAECRVPARGVRHLDRRDGRSVLAKIPRGGADPGSAFLDRRSQSDPLQLAHAVRCQEHAGADLAEGRCLLVDRHSQAVRDQRVRGEQPADPAADDHNVQSRIRHAPRSRLLRRPRPMADRSYAPLSKNPQPGAGERCRYAADRCCIQGHCCTVGKRG